MTAVPAAFRMLGAVETRSWLIARIGAGGRVEPRPGEHCTA
jgi:hypothetical protein